MAQPVPVLECTQLTIAFNRPGCLVEVWLSGRLDPDSSRYATIPEVGDRVCLALQDFAMQDLGREPLKDEAWTEASGSGQGESDETTGYDTNSKGLWDFHFIINGMQSDRGGPGHVFDPAELRGVLRPVEPRLCPVATPVHAQPLQRAGRAGQHGTGMS